MIWSLPGDFPVFSVQGEHMSHYIGEAHTLMADAPDMVYASIPQKTAQANAKFLVKAVNCHDDLVAALRAVEPFGDLRPSKELKKGLSPADRKAFDEIIGKVRAALAKVNAP
jgi:hypothetical protein